MRGIIIFLIGSIFVSPVWAANFRSISSITSSTTSSPGDYWSVNRLIQGSGAGFDADAPHDSSGTGSSYAWVTKQPNGEHGDYFDNAQPNPVLIVDFGTNSSLFEISTWGYSSQNANGVKDFSLRFATDSEGTNGFGTSISYAPTFEAAFSPSTRDSHSFTQTVSARYVEIIITDNWSGFQQGVGGGDRVGLGEIAFEMNGGPNPDPDLDTDFDGLPDSWEIQYGFDPNDDGSIDPENGPDGDVDGDGLPNRDEYFLKSDPTDVRSPDSNTNHLWQARPPKTHVMVVHAHGDDEGIFFGGLLPYTTQVLKLNVVLVMLNSGAPGKDPKIREQEMRNVGWIYGLRSQPIYRRFRGHGDLHGGIKPINNAWNAWDGNITNGLADTNNNGIYDGRDYGAIFMAEQIRRYRPEVLATHDIKGEYGHGAHKATSIVCEDAIAMAADPSLVIANLLPWQVKKFYRHMHGKTNGSHKPDPSSSSALKLFHDFWQEVSVDTDNNGIPDKTPLQVANQALWFHASQGRPKLSTCYANGETNAKWQQHPCEWWELVSSTVGDDTIVPDFEAPNADNHLMIYSGWAKGDFFEHLSVFKDYDFDDLPDDWELDHFSSLQAADPSADDDLDGLDNHYEFITGLDPHVSDQTDLHIQKNPPVVIFSLPPATGVGYERLTRKYKLLFSSDLIDWNTVLLEGTSNGTPITYPIPAGESQGFYRLKVILENVQQ